MTLNVRSCHNWKIPLMREAECLTMGHNGWSLGVCIVFLLPVLWSECECFGFVWLWVRHVRIYFENIYLGELSTPTVHILTCALASFTFTLKAILYSVMHCFFTPCILTKLTWNAHATPLTFTSYQRHITYCFRYFIQSTNRQRLRSAWWDVSQWPYLLLKEKCLGSYVGILFFSIILQQEVLLTHGHFVFISFPCKKLNQDVNASSSLSHPEAIITPFMFKPLFFHSKAAVVSHLPGYYMPASSHSAWKQVTACLRFTLMGSTAGSLLIVAANIWCGFWSSSYDCDYSSIIFTTYCT